MNMHQPEIVVGPLEDLAEVGTQLRKRWGESLLMHGRVWMLGEYKAIAAKRGGMLLGMVTYAFDKGTLLVLTLDNFSGEKGIGSRLLEAVSERGRAEGATLIRVMTTNDNTPTLRYYQLLGFQLVAFYPGAITNYRVFVPSLPERGVDGIPVRDVLELEKAL